MIFRIDFTFNNRTIFLGSLGEAVKAAYIHHLNEPVSETILYTENLTVNPDLALVIVTARK